ncbi:hypothetical protein BBUWI9123_D0017 (plasmid) [Borreliella burgdorferi WI91-23]|nr:hypothetical protein BBUWI9123_D0017 [Borreliella burgdorferi WI91-23]
MIVIKPNVSNKLTTISKSRIIKITYCFISYDNFLNYFFIKTGHPPKHNPPSLTLGSSYLGFLFLYKKKVLRFKIAFKSLSYILKLY